MPRRNPPAKWVLPQVVNPTEHLCFTVRVPNERFYIAAFRGALLDLASAYKWQDDPAHTAKQVALVWRDIVNQVLAESCDLIPAPGLGMEVEDFMPLRVDCNCRVFVTCCDGTEVELATVGMLQAPGQPSTDKRPPAGGSFEDCYPLQANGFLNLPYVVYPGDTVEITKATGSGYDGGRLKWTYANGDQMFGGIDVGFPGFIGGDPLPSAYHMRLIYAIGSTPTYVDAMAGPITVGGTGPQQIVIQVNDSVISDNAGSYTVCVKVTNTQTGTWTHNGDFTLTPDGWVGGTDSVNGAHTTWVAATGWHSGDGTGGGFPTQYSLIMTRAFTATKIDSLNVRIENMITPATVYAATYQALLGATVVTSGTIDATSGTHDNPLTIGAVCDNFNISLSVNNSPHSDIYALSWQAVGEGTDPF